MADESEIANSWEDVSELDKAPPPTPSYRWILDVEDDLVTPDQPAERRDGVLDVARSVRLFNYLVAVGHLAYHGKTGGELDVEELKQRPSFFSPARGEGTDGLQRLLEPQVMSFLQSIIVPDPEEATIFFWARGLPDLRTGEVVFDTEGTIQKYVLATAAEQGQGVDDATGQAPRDDGQDIDEEYVTVGAGGEDVVHDGAPRARSLSLASGGGRPRFLKLFDSVRDLGPQPLGVLYDQERCRVTCAFFERHWDDVLPTGQRRFLWVTLEELLSNWIHLICVGKVVAEMPEAGSDDEQSDMDEEGWERTLDTLPNKISVWRWRSYGRQQVATAVEAFDRLTAAIEELMPSDSLLPYERDRPLLTSAELDAAHVPQGCFVRELLTRVKTPRFTQIAPGLRVPHDAGAFAKRQRLTRAPLMERRPGLIAPVLLFHASDSLQTLPLATPSQFPEAWVRISALPGLGRGHSHSRSRSHRYMHQYAEGDGAIPVGLYSEAVDRNEPDNAEEGFRLLLPFFPTADVRLSSLRAAEGHRKSEVFQHGFFPCGSCELGRAQRLEVLLEHWRRMVETRVWEVGAFGVQGGIERFLDAGGASTWDEYTIRPSW